MDVCSLPCSTIFKTACSQEYDDLDTIIYGGWIRPIHSTEIDSVNLLKAPLFLASFGTRPPGLCAPMVRLAIFNAVFLAFVIPLGLDTPMIVFERLPCWVNVKQMVSPTILTAGVMAVVRAGNQ